MNISYKDLKDIFKSFTIPEPHIEKVYLHCEDHSTRCRITDYSFSSKDCRSYSYLSI